MPRSRFVDVGGHESNNTGYCTVYVNCWAKKIYNKYDNYIVENRCVFHRRVAAVGSW